MIRLLKRLSRRFFPPSAKIEGYEDPELVDLIFRKTINYHPPKAEWLDVEGVSAVLDFGGACGAHYREALHHVPNVRWAVVETPAMVQRASEIATDHLKFFSSIHDAATWLGAIDLVHSSGALQFTLDPEKTVCDLCALRAARMYWQRLVFSESETTREVQPSYLTDNGPGTLEGVSEKRVEYIRTMIPETTFLLAHSGYQLVSRGKDWFRFRLQA